MATSSLYKDFVDMLDSFLECEPVKKLVEFYKSQGFRFLSEKTISKTDKKLLQMYRLI